MSDAPTRLPIRFPPMRALLHYTPILKGGQVGLTHATGSPSTFSLNRRQIARVSLGNIHGAVAFSGHGLRGIHGARHAAAAVPFSRIQRVGSSLRPSNLSSRSSFVDQNHANRYRLRDHTLLACPKAPATARTFHQRINLRADVELTRRDGRAPGRTRREMQPQAQLSGRRRLR